MALPPAVDRLFRLDAGRIIAAAALGSVLLSLATGLLFFPSIFVFPFIVPKVLFFRTAAVALGLLLLLAAPGLGVRCTPITAAVGAFLLSAAVSTAASVDLQRSLWDTHERMLGLFTLLHYGVFYLGAATLIRDRRSWLLVLRGFVAVSVSIILLGVAQKLFPDFLYHPGRQRVASTLGNPIYLGGLGVATVFAGCLRWGLEGRTRRTEAALACALGVAGVGVSASRSSVLALAGGAAVFAFCQFRVLLPGSRARRLAGALVLLCFVFGTALLAFSRAPGFASIPILDRFAGLTLQSGGVRTRILAWEIALDAFRDRPLLGWGPANFYYAFNRHYRPELLEFGWRDTWFDSAHSAPLDALVHQGLPGLIAYLAMIVTPPIVLWRAHRSGRIASHLPCVATAFLVAHLVQMSFAFENPISYLYLMLMLAYFDRSLSNFEEEPAPKRLRIRPLPAVAAAGAAAWLVWTTNLEAARAGSDARALVMAAVKEAEPEEALAAYRRCAAAEPPHLDGVRELFAVALLQRWGFSGNVPDSPASRRLLRLAYDEIGKARVRHPRDVRLSLHRARLGLLLARISGDVDLLAEAEGDLEDAIENSPRRQEIHFLLSSVKLLSRKPEEAIRLLQVAIGGAPRVAEGWWRLALAYGTQGRRDKAREVVEEARSRGVRFRPAEEDRIRQILTGRPEEAGGDIR